MKVEDWLNSELSISIWKRKYQFDIESFDEWLDRVSGGKESIKQLILDKKFLFAGRILANRGLQKYGKKVTYSNCYNIPAPEDNLESIFDAGRQMARTFSYGGGCGMSINKLRPIDAPVDNAAQKSSGSVSFVELYNMITAIIAQKGRRGALMIFEYVNHPDIQKFIKLKSDLNNLTKTNISVGILDDFMQAVRDEKTYDLIFNDMIYKTVDARKLLKEIAFQAWDTGDPGMLMIDRIRNWNICSNIDEFQFDSPNPCGEQMLIKNGSCNLASINLSAFVKNSFTPEAIFNITEFGRVVDILVKEMDDLVDEGLPLHPLSGQQKTLYNWRNIGIGIMGMADTLIKMGIKYGSDEHILLSERIGKQMIQQALITSNQLSHIKGAFPMCDNRKICESPFIKENSSQELREDILKYGLRNCSLLSIAPTGTISNMLEISGGIEPLYDILYKRKTESLYGEDKYFNIYSKVIEDYAEYKGIKKVDGKFEKLPDYITGATAKKLYWENRIKVQSTWQKYVDTAISSTVNLPGNTTIEDVMDVYMKAWEYGCKGITVFRDNCRKVGILTSTDEKQEAILDNSLDVIRPISRHQLGETYGSTIAKRTACGKMYITVNKNKNNQLVESFINTGKAGMCKANLDGLNRLISLCLRSGVQVEEIIDQLKGIRCDSCRTLITKGEKLDGISCPDCISRVLEMQYKKLNKVKVDVKIPKGTKVEYKKIVGTLKRDEPMKCPDCGYALNPQSGCPVCINCGWSSCG